MARTKYLPKAYTDNEGNRLKVGQWVRWDESPARPNPAFYWQLTEAQPGQYQAVSYSHKQAQTFTPADSRKFRSIPWTLSKKMRLDDYPELVKPFQDRGIDAFFITSKFQPGVFLHMMKSRTRTRIPSVLLPNVQDVKKDIGLLERWLGQMIWVAENPKKYEILIWLTEGGLAIPFGIWPDISSPEALDMWSKRFSNAYREYRAQERLEYAKEVQSHLPQAAPLPGQLPPDYFSMMGDTYPLVVGEWVSTIHLTGTGIKSPLADAYLWRIHEPEPGLYTVVGYGVDQTVRFTPKISAKVYPLAIKVSERLALDKYSKYLELYRTKGLGAFFYENAHRDMVLRTIVLSKAIKDTQDIVLEPSMVAAMERSPALLESWLDQMMWCALNPERSKILFWALEHGIPVFGVWPHLIHALELAQVANLFSAIYEAEKSREKTPGELIVEQRQLGYKIDLNEQTKLMNELRLGLLDQSLSESIQSLLDGTGIDTPE